MPPPIKPGAPGVKERIGWKKGTWSVGIDCGGILAEWEAVKSLLGSEASLAFVSDNNPQVKQYILEKYEFDQWFDDASKLE